MLGAIYVCVDDNEAIKFRNIYIKSLLWIINGTKSSSRVVIELNWKKISNNFILIVKI